MSRPIYEIAQDIRKNWSKVSPYAKPYLDAMSSLETLDDNYYFDSGESVVLYLFPGQCLFIQRRCCKKAQTRAQRHGKRVQ